VVLDGRALPCVFDPNTSEVIKHCRARLPPSPPPQSKMRQQLERIVATKGLSENCYEIASKSLAA
jgi:hypothetical protein